MRAELPAMDGCLYFIIFSISYLSLAVYFNLFHEIPRDNIGAIIWFVGAAIAIVIPAYLTISLIKSKNKNKEQSNNSSSYESATNKIDSKQCINESNRTANNKPNFSSVNHVSDSYLYYKYTSADIYNMNWREFESFISFIFSLHGYRTTLTPAEKDGGKDVIAEKDGITYFIECKHWKYDGVIGRELVQKLVGAAVGDGITHIIFIATCQYNNNAREYATKINKNGFDIQLWGVKDIMNFQPMLPSLVKLERTNKGNITLTSIRFASFLNKNIRAILNKDIIETRFKRFTDEYESMSDIETASWNTIVRYETIHYLSLSYIYDFFQKNAAHNYYYSNDVVYDKRTGKTLPLQYFLIITLEQLKSYVKEYGQVYNIYGHLIPEPNIPNYLSSDYYLLENNGIALVYPPYKLSYYSNGITTIRFTYSNVIYFNNLNS